MKLTYKTTEPFGEIKSQVGNYVIFPYIEDDGRLTWRWCNEKGHDDFFTVDTFEEAKAECQDDYDESNLGN